jgi:hypothetical protein
LSENLSTELFSYAETINRTHNLSITIWIDSLLVLFHFFIAIKMFNINETTQILPPSWNVNKNESTKINLSNLNFMLNISIFIDQFLLIIFWKWGSIWYPSRTYCCRDRTIGIEWKVFKRVKRRTHIYIQVHARLCTKSFLSTNSSLSFYKKLVGHYI